jgi:predicted phage terminase large subunit-like protein
MSEVVYPKANPHGTPIKPTQAEINALFRADFRSFVLKSFKVLHPNTPLRENWHIFSIIHQVQLLLDGKIKKLVINVPPRSLKSFIISVCLPAFLLGGNPSMSIMVVSHNQKLASELADQFRKLISSKFYRQTFPHMRNGGQKDTELNFKTTEGGQRIALSMEMGVTGLGADLIIIDDPIDASEANNQAACQKINDRISKVLFTRVNNPAKTPILLVMQRLSEYDTTAHVLEQSGWETLILPAIADKTLEIPIGPENMHTFRQGDLLHPSRLTRKFLNEKKLEMGEASFMAQYMQAPVPQGAGLIDISQFRLYDKAPVHYLDYTFMSIDPAPGTNGGSYSVIQLFKMRFGILFMTHSIRGRWPLPRLVDIIFAVRKQNSLTGIFIESNGFGKAVYQSVGAQMETHDRAVNCIYYNPKTSKEDRMQQAMIEVKKGNVILPQSAKWLEGFFDEVRAFPAGRYNDQVDAFSQAVLFYSTRLRYRFGKPDEEQKCTFIVR